jgi:hypothetical protein
MVNVLYVLIQMDRGLQMFQGRMWKKVYNNTNDIAIFIFNSLLWDVNRFPEAGQTPDAFYAEWRLDYMSKVIELMRLLRPKKDELVLQNMHYIQHLHELRPHVMVMNGIIEETAAVLNLPLLDLCALVQDNEKHLRKGDYRHQTPENSLMVANQIGLRNWSYRRFVVK